MARRPRSPLQFTGNFFLGPDRKGPNSPEGCQDCTNDLLETPPMQFGRRDMGLLNLLCALALPGSEDLSIPHCMTRLDRLTEFVKTATERNLYRFPKDPDYGHSEPMWRMAMLVTNVKRDFGAAYDPDVKADLEADRITPFTDSRNVFIHGLLGDDPKRRWGSCTSLPVLVAAVARRLRYPVGLAVTRTHVYARWDNLKGYSFNIETSNPAGMTVLPDERYRNWNGPMTAQEQQSGFYARSLHPAEEFALFLKARVGCLQDAARYAETLLWSARALQFAPDDPHFIHVAQLNADLTIKHRYRQLYPDRPIPPPERNEEFFCNAGELLAVNERSLFLTIYAHHAEHYGELDKARRYYEEACRQNVYGDNEQRDYQRFLRKYGRKSEAKPLLPPRDYDKRRYFKLLCKPHEEAGVLRQLADQFERGGELLKARNALLDLYLFDPADREVFQRARAIARQPLCQTQLKAVFAQRRAVPGQNSNTHQERSI